jgi:HD-like signal output (HDOD) protein
MQEVIMKKIESLPPLPETILKIESLKSKDRDPNALIDIIGTDQMLSINILKVANSAMYGFSGKIKTVSDAVKMF